MSVQPGDTEPATLLQTQSARGLAPPKGECPPSMLLSTGQLQCYPVLVFPTAGSLLGYSEGVEVSIYPKK